MFSYQHNLTGGGGIWPRVENDKTYGNYKVFKLKPLMKYMMKDRNIYAQKYMFPWAICPPTSA